MKYTPEHEWLKDEGNDVYTVGITKYAYENLGDVVHIELPVLANAAQNDVIAMIESVKTASDIYSPITGEIIEINESLLNKLENLAENAEDDSWIFKIKSSNPSEVAELLDLDAYQQLIS